MQRANNVTMIANKTRSNRLPTTHSPVADFQSAATVAHTAPTDNPTLEVNVSHGCIRSGRLLVVD
jgi:hypothetical protein